MGIRRCILSSSLGGLIDRVRTILLEFRHVIPFAWFQRGRTLVVDPAPEQHRETLAIYFMLRWARVERNSSETC